MNRWIRALCGGLILTLTLGMCGFVGECDQIREKVVRLHVLANSDSDADQALKLRVRDAVVEAAAGMFDGAHDAGEALTVAQNDLPRLQEVAQQVVYDEGYTYVVKTELCEMYFTTRAYEQATLPAGIYDALRITIGSGEGQNWWCVVFPPMCVSAASEQSAAIEDVLEPEQEEIVTQPQQYEVRFKVVEWWESLCQFLSGN